VFAKVIDFCKHLIILKNLTDKDMLGPNLAVALISLLYAVLFQLIIVLPMRGMIQKKLK
jgi:flagellar motor component MotA